VNTAVRSGDLGWTPDELDAWWRPLMQAEEQDRFFAAITGFVLVGAR
jgi:hypothetical protein